jgi:integrase
MGKVFISPKNFETGGKALLKEEWLIRYRFYDDNTGKSKQVSISDFNRIDTLEERRRQLKDALAFEIDRLTNKGWNPITKTYARVATEPISRISETTPFIKALEYAKDKVKVVREYRVELKSTLGFIKTAAIELGIEDKAIYDVRRRDIKLLLDTATLGKSATTFNRYRKNLSGLFSYLDELEITNGNPCKGLKKQKTITAPRDVLTPEERKRVDEYIFDYDINWWLYLHIFFHSGARSTELLKIKPEHVDLVKQEVRYQILKGKHYTWAIRPIKDIALPFWQAALWNCPGNYYVFSKDLLPGPEPIHRSQIDRRWKRHIKDKLKINKNFYPLKHLNTTETSDLIGVKGAALQNAESEKMITGVYDVKHKSRKDDQVKKVQNPFN